MPHHTFLLVGEDVSEAQTEELLALTNNLAACHVALRTCSKLFSSSLPLPSSSSTSASTDPSLPPPPSFTPSNLVPSTIRPPASFVPADTIESILVDLYFHTLVFARNQSFTPAQTSALLSLFRHTHAMNISSQLDNFAPTFAHFKELLLRHCVHRPGFSVAIFSLAESKDIVAYALHTYFRHFRLYKHVFVGPGSMTLSLTYPDPMPAPLKEEPPEVKAAEPVTELEVPENRTQSKAGKRKK